MTTMTRGAVPVLDTLRRRAVTLWRALFAPGDLLALPVAIGLLVIPALALAATGWNVSLATLLPVSILSIIFGFLLARSQYNEFFALIVGGIYGFGFVILVASFNQPEGFASGLGEVVGRFAQWLIDAFTGGVNQDDLVFTLLVSSLFWFLGYNVAWHVFRIDRVWRAVLPPGLILVANAIYYVGGLDLTGYLVAFVFLSLLLMVRSHLETRHWEWYVNGIRVPKRLRRQFVRVGALLALATLLFAWIIPSGNLQERLNAFQEFLQEESARQLAEAWSRLFTAGDLQGPTTTDYYGGDSLQLSGAIRLGDQVVMLVEAPNTRRYYWRSRVFDTYANNNWTSAATTRLSDPEAPLEITHESYFDGARVAVTQRYTIALNASRLLYTAPQPLSVDRATRTDLRYGESGALQGSMYISVIRPYQVMYRGDSYNVVSLMSDANADQLRSAPADYPAEIRNVYLNVPFSATGRTLALADQIIADAGATTAFDRAKAIETWLRQNITYNETIPQPPTGQDAVDWVLFDLKEGYCNYYASAMVVMLRHVGVPARMAAGFSEGEWDEAEQAYVVRERDAHTWVEAYFPGYGWVEFEPTAAQREMNRGEQTINQPLPTPTSQQPTATPTPSPTPTPTSTPTPGAPDETPQEQPQMTATSAPTLAPTATATPVIVPTPPPPLRPPPRDPFGFLLSALGTVLIGILMIVLILVALLFVYWYWEWRGMRGMNPIVRAYARLERYLPLIGLRLAAEQTPEERRERIVRELPAAEPPVTAITRLYMTERYAPPQPHGDDDPRDDVAESAWSDARGTILGRWLRRLLPWSKYRRRN
jgi:transglutaminase-like putative cysteine protease